MSISVLIRIDNDGLSPISAQEIQSTPYIILCYQAQNSPCSRNTSSNLINNEMPNLSPHQHWQRNRQLYLLRWDCLWNMQRHGSSICMQDSCRPRKRGQTAPSLATGNSRGRSSHRQGGGEVMPGVSPVK